MPNSIIVKILEERLNQFGFVSNKRIENTIHKESKLSLIKEYMDKNKITSLEALFTSVQ